MGKVHRSVGLGAVVAYAVLALLSPFNAGAAVIFNNFGTGDTFDTDFDPAPQDVVWFQEDEVGIAAATKFTVPAGPGYNLSSVTLALDHDESFSINLKVLLVADNANSPTGATVEELLEAPPLTPVLPNLGSPAAVTFPSASNPVLTGGASYWVVLRPAVENTANNSNDGLVGWWPNSTGQSGGWSDQDFNFGSSTWNAWNAQSGATPAFRVEGVPVPEPHEYAAMVSLGLLGFAACRRRLRTG